MKYAIVGAGSRGMVYGAWAKEHGNEITAVAEIRPDRLENAGKLLNVPAERCYADTETFFAQGKLADAVIIASMDRDHYGHVMQALDCGYDILLEKPISPDARQCLKIEARSKALGRRITVCHVLRYTAFFRKIKEILDSGELGSVVAIKHSENIGNFHMAHSFVRGNWRNTALSSPIIMQKSCHDLDILLWLVGAHCKQVASFGSLTYFKEENAPAGAAGRCCDCSVAENCRFNAWRCYQPGLGAWPTDVVCLEQTEEALREALETSPYGRCVYKCDNDVCDHMSTILEFENGVTATFSLTAQTNQCYRQIHIMCEHGEILGDSRRGEITVNGFAANQTEGFTARTIYVGSGSSGHGGGDAGIMEDFTNSFFQENRESVSSISLSVESHIMACAIEESRRTGQTVKLADFRKRLLEDESFCAQEC